MHTGLLVLAVLVALVGAALLALAIRGRRTDDHPVCRRCRFDLVGVHGRDGAKCPECGSLLNTPRSIRRGNRRRSPRLAALALVLLLAGGIPAGVVICGRAAGVNLNEYKPAWWLANDLESTDPAVSDAAVSEFASRLADGELSSARRTWLIDRVMMRYTRDESWSPAWADLMGQLYDGGLLSEEQRIAYARGAPVLSIVSRPRTVQGDAWVPNLRIAAPRLSSQSFLVAKLEPISMSLNGVQFPTLSAGTMMSGLSGGGTASTTLTVPFGPEHMPGTHELSTRWRISILEGFEDDNVITSWEFERQTSVELLPAGTSLVALVDAPHLAEAIRQSVHLTANILPASAAQRGGSGMIFIRAAPMHVAFEMFCRAKDPASESGFREWKVGTVTGGPGNHGTGFNTRLPEGIHVGEVDVILRANPDAALSAVHINEIWDGEIIITGVKVTNDAETDKEGPAP